MGKRSRHKRSPRRDQIRAQPSGQTIADPILAPEQKAWMATANPRDVAEARRSIAEVLAPFDAVHAMACVVAMTAFATQDWREAETDSLLVAEHLFSVLLERGDPAPTASNGSDILASIRRAMDLANSAVSATMFMKWREHDEASDPLERLAVHLLLHDAVIRGPGHQDDEKQLLRELLGSRRQRAATGALVGLSIDDVLAFEDAMTKLAERRYRMHGLHRSEELRRPTLTQKLTVTAAALAKETGLPRASAQRFLDHFSTCFGRKVRGGAVLWGNNEIRQRPLVTNRDGRYLCTAPLNLLWSIRPAFEDALKSRDDEWEAYQRHRAFVVQDQAAQALVHALDPDGAWQNLSYDVEGVGTGYEADILIRVDAVLLSVEVKSGDMIPGALRGRRRDLRNTLEALVGKAATQARRLGAAIRDGRSLRFFDRQTDTEVSVDLEGVARIDPVVVTLRDLAWLQMGRNSLIEAGIVPEPSDFPWILSLYDLKIISDLADYPGLLTRYIAQRRALPGSVLNGADELNLFMAYLDTNLESFQLENPSFVTKHTESLDSYRLFGQEKPRMRLAPDQRRSLEALQEARDSGWIIRSERVIAKAQAGRKPKYSATVDATYIGANRIPRRTPRD